ncbi:hypothetical protein ACFLXU_06360 [Chloroflexota bacterium]
MEISIKLRLWRSHWELENLLSDRKVELADMETVKSYVEDLRNLLEDSSLAERNPLSRALSEK